MRNSDEGKFKALVTPSTSVRDAIALMGSTAMSNYTAGISVVVDSDQKVLAVVTDGDVRRGLSQGFDIDSPVKSIANFRPLTLDRTQTPAMLRRKIIDGALRQKAHFSQFGKIVLIEPDGRFYDVVSVSSILSPPVEEKTIAIYGLGFVGLTLAATFANVDMSVVGVDVDQSRVDELKIGRAPFYEKGLDSLLLSAATKKTIRYTSDPQEFPADVHIVSVGTPVDGEGKPDLHGVRVVAETIAGVLKRGDLVIFRSTLPVGTMRLVVLPILEKEGLKGGENFSLAFAPERTVEGKALEELRSLPQIVGGLNQASTNQASGVFRLITKTIVEVESLEAAEMVKLINNTFRDLIFSFANEVAGLCEPHNLNAFKLIQSANDGYPRDKVPLPSPGVGGTCLSKDPYIYSNPIEAPERRPVLGIASREINRQGASVVLSKIQRFCSVTRTDISEVKILLVGLAFKGMPATSDTRNSVALELVASLPPEALIQVKDFIVPETEIRALGLTVAKGELDTLVPASNVLIFMNNHYRNNQFNVVEALRGNSSPVLFFDGWNMFDQREIESLSHVHYATMGYMSVK